MEHIIDILKITLPALVVLYGMYLFARTFLQKELEKKHVKGVYKIANETLTLRLQAYERLCLLAERIRMQAVMLRITENIPDAYSYQIRMVSEIRTEFQHNLSQQLYISSTAWALIRNSVEENILLIRHAAQELPDDANSQEFIKLLFHKLAQAESDPVEKTLAFLREEVKSLWNLNA